MLFSKMRDTSLVNRVSLSSAFHSAKSCSFNSGSATNNKRAGRTNVSFKNEKQRILNLYSNTTNPPYHSHRNIPNFSLWKYFRLFYTAVFPFCNGFKLWSNRMRLIPLRSLIKAVPARVLYRIVLLSGHIARRSGRIT